METRGIDQTSGFARRAPDHAPEPVAPDVLVPVSLALRPRRSLIRGTAGSAVVRVGPAAVRAVALSGVVGGECAVPVLAASLVGLGEPGGIGLSHNTERYPGSHPPHEENCVRAEAAGLDVRLELRADLRAELEPDVLGEDVAHPHRAERREDKGTQVIGVLLPSGRLQYMMVGQPPVLDVLPERLAPAGRVSNPSLPQLHLGFLPGPVCGLLSGEGPGRPDRAAQVDVRRRVPDPPVLANAFPGESHAFGPP